MFEVCTAQGQAFIPPTNMQLADFNCRPPGSNPTLNDPPDNVVYSYQIKNEGQDASQPQVVGFWLFSDPNESQTKQLSVAGQLNFPGSQLIGTEDVPESRPGQTHSGTFVFPDTYRSNFLLTEFPSIEVAEYTFGVYADIYQTVTEPNELNTIATIKVRVSNACGPSSNIG